MLPSQLSIEFWFILVCSL